MGSRVQDIGDLVYLLTFAVLIGLVLSVLWVLYLLGSLPGRIASDRGHPHAIAISVCGWLGLLTLVLWPAALMWAYWTPKGHQRSSRSQRKGDSPQPIEEEIEAPALGDETVAALAENLREATEQIAAIKSRLAALPSSKSIA
jgi:Protein of unknown function (DUF3302)